MTINITVPTSWPELNQKQLRYAYFLLSSGQYEPDQIKALCLIRWGKLSREQLEVLKPEQIAAFLPMMNWLMEIPVTPVRLDEIQGHEALYNAKMHGLEFEKYLIIEAQYQGYLFRKDISFLNSIASQLYGADLHLTPVEAYSVFVWVASVKQLFASRFSNFFVPSAVSQEETDRSIHERIVKSRDTQIRALTKGDITKEAEIMKMDVWRALTELDAQAEEYNELKRMQQKHGK
jgi:hypothetical protein